MTMKNIRTRDILRLCTKALEGQGIASAMAGEIAEEFIVAELAGIKTHGIGKLVSLNLGDVNAEPVIQDRGALIIIDGRGGNGFILFRKIADLVATRCSEGGVAVAFVRNFSRYSSLYPYPLRVARRGFVGILANTAGPAAVTPFGSTDPLTGTNPICFSFPTDSGEPQTFDFATAERVWGEIRQAAIEGRALPSGPFFNHAGDITTLPAEVNAVRAFGGAKGWALNLAIELIAGPLAGAKAGLDVESEFDCGAFFMAVDPSAIAGNVESFPVQVSKLLTSVRASRGEKEKTEVRAPGDRGRSRVEISNFLDREMPIAEAVLEMLGRMGNGERISELSSNPLFN